MSNNHELPPYLETVDQQQEKAFRSRKRLTTPVEVGDFVRWYSATGVFLRRVTAIYATSVELQKIYELEDSYKNLFYSTRACIESTKE